MYIYIYMYTHHAGLHGAFKGSFGPFVACEVYPGLKLNVKSDLKDVKQVGTGSGGPS